MADMLAAPPAPGLLSGAGILAAGETER